MFPYPGKRQVEDLPCTRMASEQLLQQLCSGIPTIGRGGIEIEDHALRDNPHLRTLGTFDILLQGTSAGLCAKCLKASAKGFISSGRSLALCQKGRRANET